MKVGNEMILRDVETDRRTLGCRHMLNSLVSLKSSSMSGCELDTLIAHSFSPFLYVLLEPLCAVLRVVESSMSILRPALGVDNEDDFGVAG